MKTLAVANVEFTFIQLTEFLVSEIWVNNSMGEHYMGEIIISMS